MADEDTGRGHEVRHGWIGYGPNGEVVKGGPAGHGVVQPGALDEPGVAQRYEAAGFDFEEVKQTARAAMDGDRGRLAAAAGASPDGRTEGSQASRESDPDVTMLEFIGLTAVWNSSTHMLVLTESRLGATIELNGLQVAALRAFLRGTAPE